MTVTRRTLGKKPIDLKQLLGRIVYWLPDWKHELETEDAQNQLRGGRHAHRQAG